MTDGPPRHLTVLDGPADDTAPYDPAYDTPRGRPPIADRDAERALLASLLKYPETGADLATELDADDFYWPVHRHVWETWHRIAANTGTEPDYVIVQNTLVTAKATDAAAAVLDLVTSDTWRLSQNPTLGPTYAAIIRDHARRRTFADTFTRGLQLVSSPSASNGHLDTYLGEALQTLDDAINRYGATPTGPGVGTGLTDLSWLLDGTGPPRQPEPVYVRRHDGTALFYAGQVNGIIGDPEHGKTWLAQAAIVQALDSGARASMVDTDHNGPSATTARLLLLGARPEQLADPDRFRYYEPQDGEQLLNAVTEITARADDVTLIDSLGEVFGLLGVNENHGDEVTRAMRQVCTRPALAGTCVITVDHLPKSSEARATGFAIGSIAKKRMIRGAYLRADAKVKPSPGGVGRITLRIEKDTSGELRRSSGGGYAGELVLDSTNDYAVEWSIRRESLPKNPDGSWRPTRTMERVAAFIAEHPDCTGRDIEDDVPGGSKPIRDALKTLVADGFVVRIKGKQGAWHHQQLIPYREAEDDLAHPTLDGDPA